MTQGTRLVVALGATYSYAQPVFVRPPMVKLSADNIASLEVPLSAAIPLRTVESVPVEPKYAFTVSISPSQATGIAGQFASEMIYGEVSMPIALPA